MLSGVSARADILECADPALRGGDAGVPCIVLFERRVFCVCLMVVVVREEEGKGKG